MSKRKWYIGCSGFYYKEWKDVFYPADLPQKKWFEYYCEHFNTLEINSSFYRFPKPVNLKEWAGRSTEDFCFSIKVPGSITHYKQFRETRKMMAEFYAIVHEGLAEKLGPVLFQLPPKLAYSEEKLEAILSHINEDFINVIEFRNDSWWRDDVVALLKTKNIVFCSISFPNLSDKVIINNEVSYYRFHGVPKLFYSPYEESFLEKVVKDTTADKKVKTSFLYFNNTASTAALGNAKFVQQLIQHKL